MSSAASRDETLPILTGVRMEIDGSHISLLATDRYRLALRELDWKPSKSDLSSVALVRAKTLSDTAKALGAGDVTVALSLRAGSRPHRFRGRRSRHHLAADGWRLPAGASPVP
ncbi:hypothetical protein GCM10025876_19510 [Demequina litorisediminis]|uniref:DNA polymerase III beta sliding clamp central domain-containing protein n=1 Tax=Demequina litorisediminis TaxID=1849022 RepID=A0ABQ6IF17_9MICO|nr:hypothetical protein GCM10025876_19510 [Demequina litorisediminis]